VQVEDRGGALSEAQGPGEADDGDGRAMYEAIAAALQRLDASDGEQR
jgi:hypothetical protein